MGPGLKTRVLSFSLFPSPGVTVKFCRSQHCFHGTARNLKQIIFFAGEARGRLPEAGELGLFLLALGS